MAARPRRTRPLVSPRPTANTVGGTAPVVLVVDDEDDVREWLRLSLSLEGWNVVEAATGPDAIDQWRVVAPDVIILDNQLPGMTGLECAAELRGVTADTRIIMFTAYLDDEATREARRLHLLPLAKSDKSSLFQVLDALRDETHSANRVAV